MIKIKKKIEYSINKRKFKPLLNSFHIFVKVINKCAKLRIKKEKDKKQLLIISKVNLIQINNNIIKMITDKFRIRYQLLNHKNLIYQMKIIILFLIKLISLILINSKNPIEIEIKLNILVQ